MSTAPRRKVPILYPILAIGLFALLFGALGLMMCSDVLWYAEQGERMGEVAERDYGVLSRDHGFQHKTIADDEVVLEGTLEGYATSVLLREPGRYRGDRLWREVTLTLDAPLDVPATAEVQFLGDDLDASSIEADLAEHTEVNANGKGLAALLTPALQEKIGKLLLRFPGTLVFHQDRVVWMSVRRSFGGPPAELVLALPELARALRAP